MAQTITVSKVLATAADADGISLSQTPLAAGNLTITGALASGGVATMDTQRRVLITAAGNEVSKTFTIYGTNKDGFAISESLTGPNATTTQSLLDYLTVTRVAVSAATAGAITVGTSGVGSSPWVPLNPWGIDYMTSLGATVSGTVNYTVQYTINDDPCGIADPAVSAVKTWDITALASQSTDIISSLAVPATAWRVTVNSGTGTVTVRGLQASGGQ